MNFAKKLRACTFLYRHYNSGASRKAVFMFPGQGSQFVGMAEQIYKTFSPAKELFDNASSILGFDLHRVCCEGPSEKLNATNTAQVAIFVSSMAALELFRVNNPAEFETCGVTLGLSLGEYTALCFAKSFSFEDGVRLTKARGEAMQYASDIAEGGMLGVSGITETEALLLCDGAAKLSEECIAIGNYLSPSKFSLSGSKNALIEAQKLLKSLHCGKAVTVTPLAVAGAFHTKLMAPAADQLESILNSVEISAPRIPVISNVDGTEHTTPDDIRRKLLAQLVSPVQWGKSMGIVLQDPEFQCAYEIGPGRICSGILKSIHRRAVVHNISV